jgi:hypothetical protein
MACTLAMKDLETRDASSPRFANFPAISFLGALPPLTYPLTL